MKLIPVEGRPGLARDKNTGAIVNINSTEVKSARARKRNRKHQQNEFQQLRNEIDNLTADVNDIKMLLTKLVEKQ